MEFLYRHSSLNPARFTDHWYKKSRYKPGFAGIRLQHSNRFINELEEIWQFLTLIKSA